MPPFNSLLENVGAQILRVVALPQPSLRSDGTESPILGDHCDGTSSPADKPKTLTKYGELVILGGEEGEATSQGLVKERRAPRGLSPSRFTNASIAFKGYHALYILLMGRIGLKMSKYDKMNPY
uniref:Uncharacterized protein n=1 Tax=Timema monikensis TaxID=170555 RepID=A0A7R9HMB9_9NEOP|nr:unnamed protein product [Timema monikensis]